MWSNCREYYYSSLDDWLVGYQALLSLLSSPWVAPSKENSSSQLFSVAFLRVTEQRQRQRLANFNCSFTTTVVVVSIGTDKFYD